METTRALYITRQSFTVPGGAGAYAPERIQLNSQSTTQKSPPIAGVTAIIEAVVATAVAELWLIQPGTDPTNDANYFFAQSFTAATAGLTRILLDAWPGAQIRVKSGGTAGTVTIDASAA